MPSSSRSIVIDARPRASGLSAADPASNTSATCVTGTAVRWTYSTGIPLAKRTWLIFGKSSAESWPTGGSCRVPLSAPSVFASGAFTTGLDFGIGRTVAGRENDAAARDA